MISDVSRNRILWAIEKKKMDEDYYMNEAIELSKEGRHDEYEAKLNMAVMARAERYGLKEALEILGCPYREGEKPKALWRKSGGDE